jgi:RNAse (barnase) inhibitor barstar
MRLMAAAADAGKRTAFLDFQLFDRSDLENQDRFYRQFCATLSEQFDLVNRTDEYWDASLGYNQRCTNYVRKYLLKEISSPLLVALDEVEMLFDSTFRSDFFGMLRNWYNNRALLRDWKRLDLVLVTSTEPYMFIDNLTQSPFNVGQIVDLEDFTVAQMEALNVKHGTPLTVDAEQKLYALLNGHPFLTRKALYLVASGQFSFDDLMHHAADMRGPFGDHLRTILFRLLPKSELVTGMLQVINRGICDDITFFRLHGAGLVRSDGRAVRPRCDLYATFFSEHLR